MVKLGVFCEKCGKVFLRPFKFLDEKYEKGLCGDCKKKVN